MNSFRIGVDGGGTTTRAVIIDGTHNLVFARAHSGSSNLYNLGLEGALQNIVVAVEAALDQAGMLPGLIETFGFGLAGVVGQAERQRWTRALKEKFGEAVTVDEDVVAALVGAFGPDELKSHGGAVLIAGTGANCFAQSASGERVRADGWGPMLGDRGSGFWIGEAAIRHAVAALDGAIEPTPLSEALWQHFEVADLNQLVGVIYAPTFARERIAAFVPHVLKAARENDPIARQVIFEAACHLANTARAVLQTSGVKQLALVGGLFDAPELREAFVATIEIAAPYEEMRGVQIIEPRYEPVVGAAVLPLVAG